MINKEDLEVLHERLSKLDDDKRAYLGMFKDARATLTIHSDLLTQCIDAVKEFSVHMASLERRIKSLEEGEINE